MSVTVNDVSMTSGHALCAAAESYLEENTPPRPGTLPLPRVGRPPAAPSRPGLGHALRTDAQLPVCGAGGGSWCGEPAPGLRASAPQVRASRRADAGRCDVAAADDSEARRGRAPAGTAAL